MPLLDFFYSLFSAPLDTEVRMYIAGKGNFKIWGRSWIGMGCVTTERSSRALGDYITNKTLYYTANAGGYPDDIG